ncbi:MAG: D-glycero-beta-D-manno-heptose-7-phosphate kinase [Ferruginibacter sp.]|nr:D-glycero-beta-D-manno-heptose-7-phosphate kinase [Cytophagales bacterium]
MTFQSIEEIFGAFNRLRVLIIGDVMVDAYLWGKVERISPEAPVPIVNVQRRERRLGGAGNVALNVQSLGATPVLCSVIGTGVDGETFLTLLAENQLTNEGILQSEERITTVKNRVLSGSQQILRIDSETDALLNEEERKALIRRVKELAPTCDVVLFQDYDKGVLSKETIWEIIRFAEKRNIPTVVDPKKRNFVHYQNATLFKPNLKELREGLQIDFNADNPAELVYATGLLKQRLQLKAALITLSEKGVYIDYDDERHLLPAHIRQIADVSGAGDTVISIAALCLALRLPPRLLAGLANLGGGLVCEYVGVVPVDKERLKEEAYQNRLFEMYANSR